MFKIERTAVGRARRLRAPVRRHAAAAPARARRRRRGGEGDLDQGVRARPARRGATSLAAGRDGRRSAASARSGSATRSASRRPATRRRRASRGRRSRPSCSRCEPDEQGSLRAALAQLAEQDPLIDVRQDDHRHEIAVSLYGEVQKEVIQATLERDYGIAADFRETTTVCIERPARRRRGRGGHPREDAHEHHRPELAAEHEPVQGDARRSGSSRRRPGSGIEFRHEVEPRLVPLYLFKTAEAFLAQMEAYVREALAEGLAGWQVTDCRVTMTDCGYASPETSAADFRRLTQLVLTTALDRAGTWVCEPLADLALEMPSSTAPGVLAALGRLGGRVTGQFSANGVTKASAVLPVARVRSLQHQLPGLSMGEGILESRPGGYQPVGEHPPTRPRSRPSPLDRDAWLASLAKRG